jgi:serine/threonine protein kinase
MTTAGLRIGKYEVRERLGKGGFGVVHLGRDLELGREVAIKFLRPEYMERSQVMSRFLQEARACAKIGHPGIVTVFEAGQVDAPGERFDGTAYIVMERLHGECLGDRIKNRGKLAPIAAIGIARQLAGALRAAHEAGIIHRDLKPDNVYLMSDAAVVGGERVKVLDFGVAKLLEPDDENVHTHSRMMLGTPRYMSPEQARAANRVDHRTDIYGLGCLLYELICGKPPFSGDVGDILVAHQTSPIVPPRELVPSVPAALDELIVKMLAKDPDERPDTMAAVDLALDGVFSSIAPTRRAPTDDDDKTTRKVKPEQRAALTPMPMSPISDLQPTDRVELPTPTAATLVRPRVTQRIQSSVPAKIAIGIAAAVLSGVIAYLLLRGDKEPREVARVVIDASAPALDAELESVPVAVDAPPPASLDKILVRCKEMITQQRWAAVEECGHELTKAGGDGSEYVQRATHEASAEVALRELRTAIKSGDIKEANKSFALIPEDSVYAREAEKDFAPYRKAYIDEAVADLGRLVTNCTAWDARMRKAETEGGMVIGDAVAKRARACVRTGGTAPPPTGSAKEPEVCDHSFADLQVNRGDNLLANGAYANAVAAYEQVIKCRPDAISKLYMAACHAKQFPKAKRAFAQLTARKEQLAQICLRDGFDPR